MAPVNASNIPLPLETLRLRMRDAVDRHGELVSTGASSAEIRAASAAARLALVDYTRAMERDIDANMAARYEAWVRGCCDA